MAKKELSYEEAMQPHVSFVKKNADNVKRYYDVACAVVSGFGITAGTATGSIFLSRKVSMITVPVPFS